MKVKTTKKLILTREERKIINDLYEIFEKDDNLHVDGIWEILTDIYEANNERAMQYGYDIEITS